MELAMANSETPARYGPSALDDKTAKAVVDLAGSGTPLSTIADLLGLSRASLHRWIAIGRDEPDSPYGQLSRDILKARAEHQLTLRNVIDKAATEDPKWAAFLLEKHFPSQYGRGAQVEVHNHAAPERVEVIDVSSKSLAELEAELEESEG